VGVLYAKDYFRLNDKSHKAVMENAVKPAYFVPETVRADVLFRNMKKSRNHFAVVLDEHGGMSGIITMYDLLEQLVGDLEDDMTMPVESPLIERIDSKTWRIHGAAPLDKVSKQLGVILPENEYDTFGGLVFGILGAVPDDGSTPELEEFGLSIKVKTIKEHRLESAIVYINEDKAVESNNNT
jgi:putative hemolysin